MFGARDLYSDRARYSFLPFQCCLPKIAGAARRGFIDK